MDETIPLDLHDKVALRLRLARQPSRCGRLKAGLFFGLYEAA